MAETRGDGAPFFFASEQPPSAIAIDEDIYLTISATHPLFPGEVETVGIFLSTDTAEHLIEALSGGVSNAAKNTATSAPH
jgi:hypothetical protein